MTRYPQLAIMLWLLSLSFIQAQQITTDGSLTLENLILNNLAEGCVEISNVKSTINGDINNLDSYGYFEKGASNFPFENGIVLSTGDVNSGGNTRIVDILAEGNTSWGTDTDLEDALGIANTLNATSIEFDFVSFSNQIQFNYLLASEEYFEDNPCEYSDGFAFLIREAGSSDPFTNIALIPGTNVPVNTQTIHNQIVGFCDAENDAFFEGYGIGDTNYNGRTVVLTASTSIVPNVKYQIKLVIADQTDQNLDSAVFIEGNSFNASVDLGPDLSTCASNVNLNADINNNLATYAWYLDGNQLANQSGAVLNASASGTYQVVITLQVNDTSCTIEDDIEITLNGAQSSQNIIDYVLCDGNADGKEMFDLSLKENEIIWAVPPGNYNISYHEADNDAQNNSSPISSPYENKSSPQTVFVRAEDKDSGCVAYPTFNLVVNEAPEISNPDPIIVCDDLDNEGFVDIDLSQANSRITNGNTALQVTYHYSQQDADSGFFPIFSFYTNVNPEDTLYVRVYDSFSGCHTTTPIKIIVKSNPDINLKDKHYINACEPDSDGFASFDLTSVLSSILNGVSEVTPTFHVSEDDALNNVNPISNPENYENVIAFNQLLYIRVQDNESDCFSITTLGLHTDLVENGLDIERYILCDDLSNDGVENFDLKDVESAIKSEYGGLEITFYKSQEDLDQGTNALVKAALFEVTVSPTTLYTNVVSNGEACQTTLLVNLEVFPALELPDVSAVDYCDTDTDGFTSIVLETFDRQLTEGISPVSINYYLNEIDALNDENRLPPTIFNSSNPQPIYIRVFNPTIGCVAVKPIDINIVTAPAVNYPEPLVICDDDDDAFSIVDLTKIVPDIVPDASQLNISYFDNWTNAFNNESPIDNPTEFNATNQYIYYRVESQSTSCFNISYIYINVNTLPEFSAISIFENCESDLNDKAEFYFYLKDNEILNGQFNKQVLYFETASDAENRTNEIPKFNSYENTSNPQTIHVRVENITDQECFGTSSFALEVGSIPLFNEAEDISVCDDISNDTFETFDLTPTVESIKEGIEDNLTVTLHTSQFDAEFGYDEIDPLYTNTNNPQTIFARITNGTYCHGITDFTLSVVQVPRTTMPQPLTQCDVDYDGLVTFNLTDAEVEILGFRQNNLEITYHTSQEGVDNDNEIINNPENYTNTSNPQTVFIKINNTISQCAVSLPIDMVVNLPPPIIDFKTFEICDNTSKFFDLNIINSEISENNPDAIISYYLDNVNAENGLNPIGTNYNYTSDNDVIYIRIESAATTCHYVYPFTLKVNPLPLVTQPADIETCDDERRDFFEVFNLLDNNETILTGQNPDDFTITYHNSDEDANSDTSPIDFNYNAQNNETVYARIENNTTGCYNTTQFNTIVHVYPNEVTPLVLCDVDYDETVTFNISENQNMLFSDVPNNISISYFDDLSLIDHDVQAISNTINYTNTVNPQTIYIKVFNEEANCYNIINQELIVNTPPPINDFKVYVICENPERYVDLNRVDTLIITNDPDALLTYYVDLNDAEIGQNSISKDYNYSTVNDTLYIRVESVSKGCHYVYPFQIQVDPLPVANKPSDLETCDTDYDNISNFDLSTQDEQILGSQTIADFEISYYLSENDAIEKSNILSTVHEVNTEQIIHARIENITTGCYAVTNFKTFVRRKPINNIENQVICLENFPLKVDANTGFTEDSYLWSPNGETTSEIEIEDIGNYSLTVTSSFGCATTKTFNVIESEQATIEFEETVDFSDPNNITITVSGIGDYYYQLDDGEPQRSNFFNYVPIGPRLITVIDAKGCSSVSKEIMIFDVPKFVTPNQDGYFDTWHITGVNQLEGTIIQIYNRYGKLMKTLPHSSPGWDGTYRGENMPADDYWYTANVFYKGDQFELKGHFALKR